MHCPDSVSADLAALAVCLCTRLRVLPISVGNASSACDSMCMQQLNTQRACWRRRRARWLQVLAVAWHPTRPWLFASVSLDNAVMIWSLAEVRLWHCQSVNDTTSYSPATFLLMSAATVSIVLRMASGWRQRLLTCSAR